MDSAQNLNLLNLLFGAFGIAAVKIIWEAVKYFVDRRDKKLTPKKFTFQQADVEKLYHRILNGTIEIQQYLDKFVIETGAARWILFKLHNGGSIPQLGSDQKITILNESYGIGQTSIKNDIQGFNIDAPYQLLLLSAMQSDTVTRKTHEINDGVLKTLLLGESIKQITVCQVTQIPDVVEPLKGFMVFLSIKFDHDFELSDQFKSKVVILCEKIKNSYEKFYTTED